MTARRLALTTAALAIALAAGAVLLGAADPALAAGPFGVAAPEAGAAGGTGLFGWIARQQSAFYRELTAAVKLIKTEPLAAATLIGLSFLYGVLHAAGPGHGKAVISAYVVANGETVRRGIALSFVSAFLQATVAILLVGAATMVLNLTAVAVTEATKGFELVSGVLVLSLGLYLLWAKLLRPRARPAAHVHDAACTHGPGLARRTGAAPAAPAAAADPFLCESCGHSHAPDPALIAGPMSLRKALSAVFAVGIRPCTGALIVLVFAFSQKLWWAGVLAALAMAVGTGLTVALLATLAVTASQFAVGLAGAESPWRTRAVRMAEVGGALAILTMGVLLVGASVVGNAVAQ